VSPQQNTTPVVAQGAANPQSEKVEIAKVVIGFREQGFEPSPLDALSKLILNEDEKKSVTESDIAQLEQAKNSLDFNFTTNPLIQQYINYYQGRGRSTMEAGLRRSGRYMKIARETFRREGVPEDITWLGQVESAWNPRVKSWASASGLWQFVGGTGAQYGLRQTAWVDERNGIEKPTQASARYLKDLAKRYNGDWLLAMAAYNTGALNVDRAISRAGAANYWQIFPYIAQETRNYVPNILAVILIAKNPEKYGFHGIRPEAPMSFEPVVVPSATSLRLIADATDTSMDYIQGLNPELKRETTPRGESYQVRVPAGKGKQLAAVLKRAPADRRDTARVISIVPGEDLQSVANRTGVPVATLQLMNGGVDLKTANKLFVPNNSVKLTNWHRGTEAPSSGSASNLTKVRARKGDTIAKIAAARKLSADELARLNGIGPNVELQAGQEIKLPGTPSNSRQR
jgi:membrane-bound lytic murein transglycosylase D